MIQLFHLKIQRIKKVNAGPIILRFIMQTTYKITLFVYDVIYVEMGKRLWNPSDDSS